VLHVERCSGFQLLLGVPARAAEPADAAVVAAAAAAAAAGATPLSRLG